VCSYDDDRGRNSDYWRSNLDWTVSMKDYFKIEGPAVISFSGGRTSGYMLWRILQAHQGILPDDVKVIFANTGKEMPETLDFVRDCGVHWNVPITWVEYRAKTDDGKQIAVVNYETASRKGEPFEILIRERKYLPNPFARFCTVELKVRPMHRYLKSIGWTEWDSCIGFRADEQRRVAKLGRQDYGKHETKTAPLASAGIGIHEIMKFWAEHSFDLKLKVNSKGNSAHGNCDLCFLKKTSHIISLIRENPDRAEWWAEQERVVTEIGQANSVTGALFNLGRPSYKRMIEIAKSQSEIFDYGDESLQDCSCTD